MNKDNQKKQKYRSPDEYCKNLTAAKLREYRATRIYGSAWPTMEKIIASTGELSLVFEEIVSAYGYQEASQVDFYPTSENTFLILEHIWLSTSFSKELVTDYKEQRKRLDALSKEVSDLSRKLSKKLEELDEPSNFNQLSRYEYQSGISAFMDAGQKVSYFGIHLEKKLRGLKYQFDGKYWPTRSQIVSAIADFEIEQPKPTHRLIPSDVLDGRSAVIKDYVLPFDSGFSSYDNDLPPCFRFSNNAMADLANFVLDVDPDNPITPEAIRNVRHRYQNVCSPINPDK